MSQPAIIVEKGSKNCDLERSFSGLRFYYQMELVKNMEVIIYHQKEALIPMVTGNCVSADKLIKVARFVEQYPQHDYEIAMNRAVALTNYPSESNWYNNPGITCYCKNARSTTFGDLFYVLNNQQWYMLTVWGWCKHGERWHFEGNSPPIVNEARPYDAVLGGSQPELPPGTMVLSPWHRGRHRVPYTDSLGEVWSIWMVPLKLLRHQWRVEIVQPEYEDYPSMSWGTKTYNNYNEAIATAKTAIEKHNESYTLVDDEDFLAVGHDILSLDEFYRDWLMYGNNDSITTFDPSTNEATQFDDWSKARAYIDRVELERSV